jgi:HAD superfamily phosphoserine phosphatase-like hydrolase
LRGDHLEIFDLDRTFVRKNSSFSFYLYLLYRGALPRWTLFNVLPIFIRYRWRKLSLKKLHELVFRAILKGKSKALFLKGIEAFLEPFLKESLNPSVFHRFMEAKKKGSRTFLLSSSPDFLVEAIALRFGFDQWRGTEYAIDKEGFFCHIASLIEGSVKLKLAIDAAAPFKTTIAYSDSEDDLPLLKWAKKAVVVQPSRELKKQALLHDWEILE